ncbi:MAG: hypothetical protein KC910_23130 [Candidatus Eremiobacteraeota bacterium]|nr:hypothetical protein [Candidatus Eremiobacteraeota bacterium]
MKCWSATLLGLMLGGALITGLRIEHQPDCRFIQLRLVYADREFAHRWVDPDNLLESTLHL